MYNDEIKNKVFNMFDWYSINEISEITKISSSTLYNWRKKYLFEKEAKDQCITSHDYEKAIEMG